MCGFAGFLTTDSRPPERSLLARMCDRIAHRGPDGHGYHIDGPVALGHRRLSIIDLAGGAQPLGNEDSSLQVVFNGEIYNYGELRDELLGKGHRFSTHSDTEVLVHLYEEEGERMPERLNGMFALALWDSRRQELFLARDRFGEKPLYYSSEVPGFRLCFGSELKALSALPGFAADLNPQALADFLALSYVPDPDTIYRNVRKLPAAHSLLVTRSGIRIRRYWTPAFAPDASVRLNDEVERVRSLAEEAVACRLMSDVPLGGFLSGGVDSSAVVACMARRATGAVKTFSIGFDDKRLDELEYARRVAERYRTEHHEQVVTPDILEVLDTLVRHYDEPFGDSSAIPTLYLSRMTRRHVTVALSGDGADELFGGYRRYALGVVEHRLRERLPGWFRRGPVRWAGDHYPKLDFLPRPFRAKATLLGVSQELADAYFNAMSSFRDGDLTAVLSHDARRDLAGYSPRDRFRSRFADLHRLPPLQQMQSVDLETYLPGQILVKVDRATMAYSLESRAPFLDPRLAEVAFRQPMSHQVQGMTGKLLFKQAVRPLVPEVAITRPKMGFSVPLASWFRTSLRPMFESTVLHPEMEAYLDLPEVRRLWAAHQSGRSNHQQKLWNLLMLACWRATHQAGVSDLVLQQAL